jgi:serine protease Do
MKKFLAVLAAAFLFCGVLAAEEPEVNKSTDTVVTSTATVVEVSTKAILSPIELAMASAVQLEITREVAEHIPDKFDKKGRITEKGGTVYHYVNIGCSANYITPNLLLTNAHCVKNQTYISAVTEDGFERPAEVLYVSKDVDLALLHTFNESEYFIPVATAMPKIGDVVYAYGMPMGISFAMTKGIISKIHPSGDYVLMDQTVLPGNSGSALFNDKGELVGVCNALINSNPFLLAPTGLSVAVSVDAVRELLEKFKGL